MTDTTTHKTLADLIETLQDNLYVNIDEDTSDTVTQDIHNLKTLYDIKNSTKEKKPQLSPDAVLAAGTNLAGILAILNYERLSVIASKALGFVSKTRI